MMLHRHFERENTNRNMTKTADLNRAGEDQEKFVSDIFPPDEKAEQPKRGRRKKAETE